MGQPVMQFQVLAKNPDRAAKFYGDLFGWTVSASNALAYRTIDTGSKRGIQGGIWPSPPEAPCFVQLFVEVEDVAGHVGRAQELGGKVVIPPQRLPDGDHMAVILDSEGIAMGLFTPAAKRKP